MPIIVATDIVSESKSVTAVRTNNVPAVSNNPTSAATTGTTAAVTAPSAMTSRIKATGIPIISARCASLFWISVASFWINE